MALPVRPTWPPHRETAPRGERLRNGRGTGRLHWDGTTLCEQTTHTPGTGSGALTLTWDHQGVRPLTQTERKTSAADTSQEEIDARFYAIVTDLVGTPTELVDEQGDIAWRARSTLWGTTAWNRTATAYTPLRFPGQYFDPETGLHYNYFRHYDAETARYLTSDPLGLDPAPNPTAYVHNPHTWTDPLGLAACHEYHTVQDPVDAARLRQGGDPWPTEDIRGQYGEGVYAWENRADAEAYAQRLRDRGFDVDILSFKVSGDDFGRMNRFDVDGKSTDEIDAFMEAHSRLYGDGLPHAYDHVRGYTGMGIENYFSRSIFHLLQFD